MDGRKTQRGVVIRWTRATAISVAVAATSVVATTVPASASGGTTSGADIRLNGSLSTSQPAPGSTFTETYLVQNRGPDNAVGVQWFDLNDPDNPGMSVTLDSVSVNGGAGNCSTTTDGNGNPAPFCDLGDLASGAQDTVVVTRTAPTGSTTYTFFGDAGSQTADPQTTNNDARLTIQVTAGGGGTTTPPPTSGACATVDPSSASQTLVFTTNTMSTKISNCGTTTLTNVVVMWNAGDTATAEAHSAFDCSAPNTAGGSFTLAAGSALTVNCKKNGYPSSTPTESGTGTVSVYDQCASPNQTLVSGGVHCTDEPQTLLAQAAFSWFLAVPASAPPRGGGRGGTG